MENQDHSQLELFSQANIDAREKARKPVSFLFQVRGHEKILIGSIISIIIGVVCFSLGVEQGKRMVYQRINLRNELAQIPAAVKVMPPAVNSVTVLSQQGNLVKPQVALVKPEEGLKNYTIQVASFQTKVSAEKVSAQLKKKGLNTLVLSKGRFIVLCVGRFSDKETAKPVLTELKKQYRDCFIRRM